MCKNTPLQVKVVFTFKFKKAKYAKLSKVKEEEERNLNLLLSSGNFSLSDVLRKEKKTRQKEEWQDERIQRRKYESTEGRKDEKETRQERVW